MRCLIRLEATRDAAYNPEYHHKLRGCLWNALRTTDYQSLHGDSTQPTFTFSNPFPPGDIAEDDERMVLVSSPHDGLIQALADSLDTGADFNIGEMPFTIDSLSVLQTDVGEPGTTGTLETSTGVYIRLPEEQWEEYGINPPVTGDVAAWTPDFSLGLFLQRVRENLRWKHDTVFPEYLQSVTPETELFEDASLNKVYSVDVPVSSNGYEKTFIVSKWTFGYRVRNDDHRRWLNLLLDSGIGWRNSLGFGFVNKQVSDK